ncbi:hypothetical protein DH86_00001235 [Scytalidium sp. 3C]|nr:hypothetical protein DH86_00001235 [Scytalidium sp. 3C]
MTPPFSRNSSANTIQQSRHATQTSPRPAHAKLHKRSHSPLAKGRPSPIAEAEKRSPDLEQSTSPDASSSEADSDSEPPAESRILRRPPARFTANKLANSDADDDEEGPAFMPFVPASTETNRHHDLSATLRGDSKNMFRRPAPYRKSAEAAQQSQTSDSSASSIAVVARRSDMSPRDHEHAHRPGPLSPRRTAELARQSPRFKGKGREGSDGTPSMGSSFSDLDG